VHLILTRHNVLHVLYVQYIMSLMLQRCIDTGRDDYYMGDSPVSEAAGHRKFYEEAIYPLLHPHQKVYLVPGAFATHEPTHTPLPPAPGPAPPPLPPANSSGCAACPSSSPYGYGNAVGGAFCCPVATTDDKQHCPASSCCLTPGSSEGCQNVKRCGTNPGV
jgi:hypothetical protein